MSPARKNRRRFIQRFLAGLFASACIGSTSFATANPTVGAAATGAATTAITLRDDLGHAVTLQQPARRIVSLAPHLTEMLYAAGLGAYVVGAVSFSDYPPEARNIARIGGYHQLDLERITALQPDLVVAWHEGNHPAQLATLRRLGLQVHVSNPLRLDSIADTIEQLGQLGDNETQARAAAAAYRQRLAALEQAHAKRPPLRVFYQVWHQPPISVNDDHPIGQAIRLCGGHNVFGKVPALTPTVSIEAVIQAAPEVIVASGMDAARPDWLENWRTWSQLPAVQHDNLYFIPPDLLQRPGPRLLQGVTQLCQWLEQARRQMTPAP